MSDLVCSVFTGNPPKNIKGLDEFKKGLIDANIQLPGGDPPPKPKEEEVKVKPNGKRERKIKKRDSQEGYVQQKGDGPPGKRIQLEFLYKR